MSREQEFLGLIEAAREDAIRVCSSLPSGRSRDPDSTVQDRIDAFAESLSHPQAASSTQAGELDELAAWIEHFGGGYADRAGFPTEISRKCDRIAELLRLASSTTPASGEAVAWRYFQRTPNNEGYWVVLAHRSGHSTEQPLYTAPPATRAPGVDESVEVVRIPKPDRLDPITVYLADEGGGRGRMTSACYNEAWTCYWGAMGSRTLRQFVASCDASYVAGNMLCGRKHTDHDREYAERIAAAVIAALTAAQEGGE